MNYEETKNKIQQYAKNAKLRVVRDSLLLENSSELLAVAKLLKDSEHFRFDYLSSVTAADYLDFLETVYHFYSVEKKTGPFVLRVRCTRENPKTPSLVSLFRGAEYQERECYDMFGIIYEGHPDLRRIFMWEGFEGFPLRKDYEQEDSETLEMADIEWLDRNGIPVPEELRKKAEAMKAQGKRAVVTKEGKEKE